jgi:hypothetical protein
MREDDYMSEVQVTWQLADSQPVCLGVESLLGLVTRVYITYLHITVYK